MEFYQDITVLPNEAVGQNALVSKIYLKLHMALKDITALNVGVSFPKYNLTLGDTIRLHGNENDLTKLQNSKWLNGLAGFCKVTKIEKTPDIGVKHRTVFRWQSNMGKSKLRRLIKRKRISESDTKNYQKKMMHAQLTNLPYLVVQSVSNGQWYRRYIKMGELTDEPILGKFDTFGLSKQATIPWF